MHTSFWEQDAMLDADLLVVGGGIIGLQTALEWRAAHPRDRIAVLERGLLPAGASTRNAGFACFGSLTEILHDIDAMGADAALALVERRWRGLHRLRERLGEEAMGYEGFGGYELLFDEQLPALERLGDVNALLRPLFGRDVFDVDADGLAASGFGPRVRALVRNPLEGQVHSGRMLRNLAGLAMRQGIAIHTGARVGRLDEDGDLVRVQVGKGEGEAGAEGRELAFRAPRVALCTNGVARELLPDCGIVPGRGQVIVTDPIPGLPWRGTYHLDEGFYYFRNVGERILLGGARNLDFAGEESGEMVVTERIQSALETLLHETLVPSLPRPRIAHRWAGIMGFAADKQPVVRKVTPRIALGFGCNGMGVALGADIAAETAALLA